MVTRRHTVDKAAQPSYSEKNAASRAGQTPPSLETARLVDTGGQRREYQAKSHSREGGEREGEKRSGAREDLAWSGHSGGQEWVAYCDEILLEAVFDYGEDEGGPLVTVDATTSLGTFLAPIVALRGGNASLLLHLLEFLFSRFLVKPRDGHFRPSPCVPMPAVPVTRGAHGPLVFCARGARYPHFTRSLGFFLPAIYPHPPFFYPQFTRTLPRAYPHGTRTRYYTHTRAFLSP